MDKFLVNLIKKMSGSVVCFGLDDGFKPAISQNDKITSCYLLEEASSSFGKKKFRFPSSRRKVNIKKIRKAFKKKKIDNVICNYDTIKGFLKTFIKDSIYINRGKLYIYGDKSDLDFLISRYKKYNSVVTLKPFGEKFVLVIDNSKAKTSFVKDVKYWWMDTLRDFVDFLTMILAN